MRQALDFVRADGGTTGGTPQVASAAGVARRYAQPSGAGNYVVIDHGGGWTTYYFHLSAYSVPDGAYVEQGQQIGVTGSTVYTTGPHVHYEQLYNGVGQSIVINGVSLAPYPSPLRPEVPRQRQLRRRWWWGWSVSGGFVDGFQW